VSLVLSFFLLLSICWPQIQKILTTYTDWHGKWKTTLTLYPKEHTRWTRTLSRSRFYNIHLPKNGDGIQIGHKSGI